MAALQDESLDRFDQEAGQRASGRTADVDHDVVDFPSIYAPRVEMP